MTSDLSAAQDSLALPQHRTLVDALRTHAREQPGALAFRYLASGDVDGEKTEWSYAELHRRAAVIAVTLRDAGLTNERVLLLYPSGLDLIAGFMGCLYGSVVAVPAFPPDPSSLPRTLPRLRAIALDARVRAVLTTSAVRQLAPALAADTPEVQGIPWIATDEISGDLSVDPERWAPPDLQAGGTAFLQYTSGSTRTPRGVIVSHANLFHNHRVICDGMRLHRGTHCVGWLPLYHDMGLIGNVLAIISAGGSTTLLAPEAFLSRPMRWLSAISRFRGTVSGAPNFAYDLCVRKSTASDVAALDLSSWELAYSGAEPVLLATLDRFAARFAACGFRRDAFYQGYGLAESTLMSTGGSHGVPPRVLAVQSAALQKGLVVDARPGEREVTTFVSAGHTRFGNGVAIVDPATATRTAADRVGEIWMSGPSVTGGYFNQPEASAETFGAHLADEPDTEYLRTGDLGFVRDNELFVIGRLKDLIIIGGRNHYPQDIELTVVESHPAFRPGCCVAFGIADASGESVVIVAEVDLRRAPGGGDEVLQAARRAIGRHHALPLHAVALVEARALPKTSSGKIQRYATRTAWTAGQVTPLALWSREVAQPSAEPSPPSWTPRPTPRQRVVEVLRAQAAAVLGVPSVPFAFTESPGAVGFDSIRLVELQGLLESALGASIPIALLAGDPSFEDIITRIVEHLSGGGFPAPPPRAEPGQPCVAETSAAPSAAALPIGLFFFSSDATSAQKNRYRLLLESAQIADERGLASVWIPERHFHPFGGLFPNPSVLAAAVAVRTRRVRIRAGSVVLPLHDPIRVAEEWSVVDQLSNGRVDLAFATGWDADSFVLAPGRYPGRESEIFADIDTVRRLWRGERLRRRNGAGEEVEVAALPGPVSTELSCWLTVARNPEHFDEAGARGLNLLTALLFQPLEQLAGNIRRYRAARERAGLDPSGGRVTLMLHTFVGQSQDEVVRVAGPAFRTYLASSVDLWRRESVELAEIGERKHERLLDAASERYMRSASLLGDPGHCASMIERLRGLGADEVACLIDFGVPTDEALAGVRRLAELVAAAPAATRESLPLNDEALRAGLRARNAPPARTSRDVFARAREFAVPQDLARQGLDAFYRPFEARDGAYAYTGGRRVLMLGSLDYLGLAIDPRVRAAAAEAAQTQGTSCTGSRLHNGSRPEQRRFERQLADFLGHEDGLVFATGYQAMLGLITGLLDSDATVVLDEFAHASLYDGALMARSRIARFRHNDVGELDRVLADIPSERPALVVVEGVYSNEGDLAPLPEIARTCAAHGTRLALDDAHGLGVLGERGRGAEEHFGVRADVVAGTFSKSLGSIGGWIVGPAEAIEWIRYRGRSILFSAAISPPNLAAAAASLRIISEEPERVRRVQEGGRAWARMLTAQGLSIGNPAGPIVPVILGDELVCLRFAHRLLDEGIYTNVVLHPSVPLGHALLRTCVTALHTPVELEHAAGVIGRLARALGVVSPR